MEQRQDTHKSRTKIIRKGQNIIYFHTKLFTLKVDNE